MAPGTSKLSRPFWLTILALTFAGNGMAAWMSYARWEQLGVDLLQSVWGILAAAYLVMIVASVVVFVVVVQSRNFEQRGRLNVLESHRRAIRAAGWAVFLIVLLLIPYLKFTFQVGRDKNPFMDATLLSIIFYWLCWYALLIAMVAMKMAFQTTWQVGFVSAMVLLGVTYEVLARFNAVTTYPLSMGWSEGSRYYYASLYFSPRIYGEFVPLSTLHPSRYLLQAIPFLIPGSGIPEHRFWQFLLWIGLTATATLALARRAFPPEQRLTKWLFAGWAFLFLLRLGVYYHLQVMVILPLLLVSPKHPWRSLLAVIFASIWAGISRVNWFAVPAMIAIALYLLETPLSLTADSKPVESKQILAYFKQPALWAVAGLLSALASQALYIFLSGNQGNSEAFASSFTSDLLWYRLWPNPNHFLGILPAILIVSAPLILVLVQAVRLPGRVHPLRWWGLFLMIGVLFVGSLVVSVKIGGGGDLHNMDAYAILISIAAAYMVGGRARPEPG
ncbi:MAG TPA: hypothetical protein VFY25_08145, partial [Anaerolineales bacterium]|nr:hypothetical protein [Anaerolineales bacterium]